MRQALALTLFAAGVPLAAQSPGRPDPTGGGAVAQEQATMAAERAAMAKLVNYDGSYRGRWKILRPEFAPGRATSGTTEHRVGTALDGTVKVMEGRNLSDMGALSFHGMIVMHYDVPSRQYRLTVFANGRTFETPAVMTPTGYYFEEHNGPTSVRRINIVVTPGAWSEYVEAFNGDTPPVRIFEMTLPRAGPANWPGQFGADR